MVVILPQSTTVSRLFFGELQEKVGRGWPCGLTFGLQGFIHSLLRPSLPALLFSVPLSSH